MSRIRRGTVRSWLSAMCVVWVAAGCATTTPPGLSDEDRAAIAAATTAGQAAANAADWDAWGAVYAEDAIVLPPNGAAMSGRAAIIEGLKAFPPLSDVRFTHVTVEGTGDWAWVHGRYELTVTPPGAPAMSDRGNYLEIWRKQADGTWQIYRDSYNSEIPLPAPDSAAAP